MQIVRKLKLFHRIVFHGILMILAVAVAAILAFHYQGRPSEFQASFLRASTLIVREIQTTNGSAKEIEEALTPFHYVLQSSMAVYRIDGALVAELGDQPIPPLSRKHVNRLRDMNGPYHRSFGEVAFPLRLNGEFAYLIINWKRADTIRIRFVLAVVVSLTVIGLMSIPLARSIARPVRLMTETAERLRDGDLGARAVIDSNDEFAVLGDTLNDMAAGLDARIRREKELLANVSHELRTPLSRIRVALEIAEEATDERTVRRQLGEIATDAKELEQLVNDVLFSTKLDFSRVEKGAGFKLDLQAVPLGQFLREAAERFEKENEIKVETDFLASSRVVRIDTVLFNRVIDNLLSNARKYSLGAPEIALTLRFEKDAAVVSVKDRGMGVSEENLSRLFEPFFRTEKSRSRNEGGMGLGLTLAKRVVETHGGTISARGRSGGGLVISVCLPIVGDTFGGL